MDIFPVQHCRHIAGNDLLFPFSKRLLVIKRDRCIIDGKPVSTVRSQQVTGIIKFKDNVKTEVNITIAVIIKEVVFQAADQVPLFLRKFNDILPVFIQVPYQKGRVKTVLCNVSDGFLLTERPAGKEASVAVGISGNGLITSAEKRPEKLRDQIHITRGRTGISA